MRRTDPSLLRLLNLKRVLDTVFDVSPAPISRAEIVRSTGLAKPTVSSLMAELEVVGLVRMNDPGKAVGDMGRPPALYEIEPGAGYVLGADIGATKIIVGIADLLGRVIGERVVSTKPAAIDALAQVGAIGSELLASISGATRIEGACVAVPGVYRATADCVNDARNLAGFDGIRVADTLRAIFGAPVMVENDVNLAALAESWLGSDQNGRVGEIDTTDRAVTDFVAISVGTGLGMGMIVNRQLYRGGSGASGEIGSVRLATGLNLEDIVSGPAICKAIGVALEEHPTSTVRRDAEVPEILSAAETGDPAAVAVVQLAAEKLAEAIAWVALLFDPQLVVLGGGIGSNPAFSRRVEQALEPLMTEPPPVRSSTLGNRAAFLGAIGSALRQCKSLLIMDRLTATEVKITEKLAKSKSAKETSS